VARQPNAVVRALGKVVASRPGAWFYVNVAPHADRRLLRWSNGRLSISVGQPVALLEVVGAKSGEIRHTPLVFATDGDDVIFIASRGGDTRHPGWFHNVRANPDVKLYAPGGRTGRYRARIAEGEERERAWRRAVRVYPGYDTYQERAGDRRIPVVVLSPAR
jgi:deazaflavin-dependent oxidoreductase (nitroreductase family)